MARLRLAAENSPEAMEEITGVPARDVRGAARLYATGGNGSIYYGLGVTEHSQGSTTVMAIANLAMATGNVGREGVGVNRCAARTTCGVPATWARSRTNCPATATSPTTRARAVRARLGRDHPARARPAHPQYVRGRAGRHVQGAVLPGRGHRAVRPEHAARGRGAGGDGVHRGAGPVPERDRQVRPRLPAGLVLPGKGRHLHQRRAPHLARAQGHGAQERQVGLGSDRGPVQRAGLSHELPPPRRDHGRDRPAHAHLRRGQL